MGKKLFFRHFISFSLVPLLMLSACGKILYHSSASIDPAPYLSLVDGANWSFFDDAVFIGDSVSLKLRNYVMEQRKSTPNFLGKAQFLTAGSLGSGNALWEVSDESVHPAFQGIKMRLEESVPLTKANKVFIMLGINDLNVYGIDGSIENYQHLLELIQEFSPNVEFYLQSATPIYKGHERNALNNENLRQYNQKLFDLCQDHGYHFVDVASVMYDDSGYLAQEYCSDPKNMGIHMTDMASRLWIGYLLSTVNDQEDTSFLQNAMDAMTYKFPIDEAITLDENDMLDFFGISADTMEQFSAQICSSSISVQEIILVKAVDEESASMIEAKLQSHLDNQMAQTYHYLPEEYDILSQCKVQRNGVNVALIVSKEHKALENIYTSYISPR